jgi:hypothetical protein
MLDEREWLTPEILATQEAEIRRIHVQSQPGQIVLKILSQKNPTQNRTGGVHSNHSTVKTNKNQANAKPMCTMVYVALDL